MKHLRLAKITLNCVHMESEEKDDQEEGGMKEQRPQRRIHICKLNNGQIGMGGVLVPEVGISRCRPDIAYIYCGALCPCGSNRTILGG
jgi:hypothetical protein